MICVLLLNWRTTSFQQDRCQFHSWNLLSQMLLLLLDQSCNTQALQPRQVGSYATAERI
jgi:hypothetical protein